MITQTDIKQALFADEMQQSAFIVAANECRPPIPGESFDEKLTYLLHSAPDSTLQLMLAPFLRARLFKYLSEEETASAKAFKNEYIGLRGEELFEAKLNMPQPNASDWVTTDFLDLKNSFIKTRGNDIWEAVQSPLIYNTDHERNSESFIEIQQRFAHDLPESEWITLTHDTPPSAEATWDRIHKTNPATQAFDAIRHAYSQDWSKEIWQEYCSMAVSETSRHTTTPEEVIEQNSATDPTETALDFPAVPDPLQEFIQNKKDYIRKHGETAWEDGITLPPISIHAYELAHQLKYNYIEACGTQQWLRLFHAPHFIQKFDYFKKTFIANWGEETWTFYLSEPDETDTDPQILADFKERKRHFNNETLDTPDAWQQGLAYPAIPAKSQTLIDKYRNMFIKKWGAQEWNHYLTIHNSQGEYATDTQIKDLAEIFHLRVEVTDINASRTQTYCLYDIADAPTIHFYCENNVHYYIHEGGYSETIGNGDCFYNGFSQWLKLLLLNQQPRRIMVMPDTNDVDIDSYVVVQRALSQTLTNASQLQVDAAADDELQQIALSEELTIKNIRKELALELNPASINELGKFIQTKANALIHIIRAKNLPFRNRIPLLQKISKLATQLHRREANRANLITLQTILLHITNTTCLPHTKDVSIDWTNEAYDSNLLMLQTEATDRLPQAQFEDLSAAILATDFRSNEPENVLTRLTHQPNYSGPVYSYPSAEPEEDYLSAALCIAGIFMLITSITFLLSLILLALTTGLPNLGLILMQSGLASMAQSLGGVIGLSTPNAAILLATGMASIVAGLGFTMFKDFAPRNMLSLDSFIPSMQIF